MGNTFGVNHPFLFLCVAVIILFVIAQSVYFLVKAWRRAKAIGISREKLKKVVGSSAVFTVAPAVAILLGVIALSKKLGIALPWLRLSVIGALTYELTAAEAAASAVGTSLAESSVALTAEQFSAITWVMTLGIMVGIILTPLVSRKVLAGMNKMKSKDVRWGGILSDALFLGMISAFLGMIFATVTAGLTGWIPFFVMVVSALLMGLCGLTVKKLHWKWMEDYALPISLIAGMLLAIPITNGVYGLVGLA